MPARPPRPRGHGCGRGRAGSSQRSPPGSCRHHALGAAELRRCGNLSTRPSTASSRPASPRQLGRRGQEVAAPWRFGRTQKRREGASCLFLEPHARSAPRSSNSVAAAMWPFWLATNSGVAWSHSLTPWTSSPRSRQRLAASTRLCAQASNRGGPLGSIASNLFAPSALDSRLAHGGTDRGPQPPRRACSRAGHASALRRRVSSGGYRRTRRGNAVSPRLFTRIVGAARMSSRRARETSQRRTTQEPAARHTTSHRR